MRVSLSKGVSTLSMIAAMSLVSGGAYAQVADEPSPANSTIATEDDEADTIIVTGSRIVSTGFTAPTPVTAVTTEELTRTTPGAIPEALNQLPQFAGSSSNLSPSGLGNRAATGNYLNLRNLGAGRNLVLLDGQRLPPTNYEGTTDSNVIPQALIQRVEVVTGGASAAYGSDAVSGVINYILDTRYNGVKGQIQYGITEYGDSPTLKANFAFGADITDRLHVLGSYDHYEVEGIIGNESRPIGRFNWGRIGNGTSRPYQEFKDIHFSNSSYHTQISTSNPSDMPLWGYHFTAGGLAVPMDLGTPSGDGGKSIGGEGAQVIGRSLTASQNTEQLFGRLDYEISDDVTAFVQLSYADSFSSSISVKSGTQVGNFRIFTENAFIADETRQILEDAGIESWIGSRVQADQPPKRQDITANATILMSGIKGSFGNYNWDVGYSHGDTSLDSSHFGNFYNQRFYAGLDAVRNDAGEIVCRITITDPGVLDDCIPFNIFGSGSPSQASYDYISGSADFEVKQSMDIFTANISGEIFELPAGAVSVAIGAEYRRQDLVQTSNADPSQGIDTTGLRTNTSPFLLKFNSTNVGATQASQNVKEGYVEVFLPLFQDAPFARELSINAAGRYTDYSTSGGVTTWKVGGSWSPIDAIRFRATRSRDIRAPSLNELFGATNSGQVAFYDAHTDTNARLSTTSSGNPDLTPELADTFTGGVVIQPGFLPGLQMSVDYYDIEINDAIGTPNQQLAYDECEDSMGTAPSCDLIIRPFPWSNMTPENFPTVRRSFPINQSQIAISGIDYEISYRTQLGFGMFDDFSDFSIRLIGGHLLDYTVISQAGVEAQQTNNSGNNSQNRVNLNLNYQDGPLSLSTQTRYIGPRKKFQNGRTFAEGFTNDIPSRMYTNATVAYSFERYGGEIETYITIANLFDQDPPLIPGGGQPGQAFPTQIGIYDVFGRAYTAGVRVEF